MGRYTKFAGSVKDATTKITRLNAIYNHDGNPYMLTDKLAEKATTTEDKLRAIAVARAAGVFKPVEVTGNAILGNEMFTNGVRLDYSNGPKTGEEAKIGEDENTYSTVRGAPSTRFTPPLKSPGPQTSGAKNLEFSAVDAKATGNGAEAITAFTDASSGNTTTTTDQLGFSAPATAPAQPGDQVSYIVPGDTLAAGRAPLVSRAAATPASTTPASTTPAPAP